MESLVLWVILLSIPSAIGAVSYLLCRRIKYPAESVLQFMALGGLFVFPLIFSLACDLSFKLRVVNMTLNIGGLAYATFLLVSGGLAWMLGSWAHTKTTQFSDDGWLSCHFLVYSATFASLLAGWMSLAYLNNFTGGGLGGPAGQLFQILYLLLLAYAPSMTAFLLWIIRASKLRPGIDVHFED